MGSDRPMSTSDTTPRAPAEDVPPFRYTADKLTHGRNIAEDADTEI